MASSSNTPQSVTLSSHSALSPTSTTSQPQGNGVVSTAQASSLYLYTFLATLVLLLAVSSAVVLRSITLRVRQRRAIEEAIRNGTYVPPEDRNSSRAPVPTVKPVLHDAYLLDADEKAPLDEKGKGGWEGKDGWSGIMPVAVSVVSSSDSLQPPTTPVLLQIRRQTDQMGFFAGIYALWSERPGRRNRGAQQSTSPALRRAAPSSEAQTASDSTPDSPPSPPPSLRVAVLIAMPDPSRSASASRRGSEMSGDGRRPSTSSSSSSLQPRGKGKARDPSPATSVADDAEETVPYVEFGVVELPISRGPVRRG